MVDVDPPDPDLIRAVTGAARLGKDVVNDALRRKTDRDESGNTASDGDDASAETTEPPPSISDVNNPTINTSGSATVIINNPAPGNYTVEVSQTVCCYDYPDGICPHRRGVNPG